MLEGLQMTLLRSRGGYHAQKAIIAVILCSAVVGCSRQEPATTNAQANGGSQAASAETEISTGKRLLAEGKYEQAVEHLTTALKESGVRPNQLADTNQHAADVYYNRGLAYLKMGFPDTAVEDFAAAIDLAPLFADAIEARAQAYIALGDTYKSLRDATQAIRLKPHNAAAYHTRGIVYTRRAQYDRAVADLEQAIKENPQLADQIRPQLGEAYYRWSRQLTDDGDITAATAKLAKARDLNPQFVEQQAAAEAERTATPTVMGTTSAVQQTVAKPVVDEAQKPFEDGRANQTAKKYDQALMDYTRAIALRSQFYEAYLRRGETLLALGFPDTALEDFNMAARGKTAAEAHRMQAKAYLALGNPQRAELAATDALHADPTSAAAYALRGEAYLKIENWTRAVADLDEAIRRDPSLKERLQPLLEEARLAPQRERQRELERQREVAGNTP
jgi:tetratricopeptide (TPR) repeat protein